MHDMPVIACRRWNSTGNVIIKKNKRGVLFVDEVHRFNKSQEDGSIVELVNDREKGMSWSVGMRVDVNDDAVEFVQELRWGLEIDRNLDSAARRHEISSFAAVVTMDDVEALQCKHLAYDKAKGRALHLDQRTRQVDGCRVG
ncbi:hypothetical protein GQ457_01G051990 [Hibiscus cannabinus]